MLQVYPDKESRYQEISLKHLLECLNNTVDKYEQNDSSFLDEASANAPSDTGRMNDTTHVAHRTNWTPSINPITPNPSYVVSRVNYRDVRRLEHRMFPVEGMW